MSVGRDLIPEADCSYAFRFFPSLSKQTRKRTARKRPNGCKDSANRIQSSYLNC